MSSNQIQVAAYYFPQYHSDAHNDRWHGPGWTEWELVRYARPRFPNHRQPKIPLWGYADEADPAVQSIKIQAAVESGLSAWIWDWYWYEDGPFLNRALEEGYLKAENHQRLPFALMWANHDWLDIHPAKYYGKAPLLAAGCITPHALGQALDYIAETYFSQDAYWRVGGGLYFSFYEVMNLINTCGGMAATRKVLDGWRERVLKLGLGTLHLNAVVWGLRILQTEKKIADVNQVVEELGFDSVTSYVWIHHQPLSEFPTNDYQHYTRLAAEDWSHFRDEYRVPYFPNVTMGWDSSPRTIQTDRFEPVGYPYTATLTGNTPAAFRHALQLAREFLLEGRTRPPVLTINAWNEWTEGSYLEPDMRSGLGYLDAIREVFGPAEKEQDA